MTLQPFPGFRHVETHHCITGSLRHIYLYNEHDLSEELLLGIGNGVGFVYWHQKGAQPFIGGCYMDRERGYEVITGERTGVGVTMHTTSSARKAEQSLLDRLERGEPVMLQVDMGYLPYFDFGGEEYHFGYHVVVACGYDPATRSVLIADRDADLHPVPLETLAAARGSTYKPFPPQHKTYTFDFSAKHAPTADDVRLAICEQAQLALDPPIRNIGVSGIRKAGASIPKWPDTLDTAELRATLFNTYVFINAIGGTGGGIFRYMFSRFLREAAVITGEARLHGPADAFQRIGDEWEQIAAWCRAASEAPDPTAVLPEAPPLFDAVADLEATAWGELRALVN